MTGIYELPPMLSGTPAQQLSARRAYLVRMVQQLNAAEGALAAAAENGISARQLSGNAVHAASTTPYGSAETGASMRKSAAELRQLILKKADGLSGDIEAVGSYADGRIESLGEQYLARSEFGAFTENIESQIANTARGVVESYGYSERIESNQANLELLQTYVTDIDGEIRRGLVTDPATGETVTGIAIAQNLQFTGEVSRGSDGMNYYTLSSGQTFGLYTSTGWQFWINGYRRGWYDSVDGMLHIANVAVEDSLQLGGAWRLTADGGLGIKYTGG